MILYLTLAWLTLRILGGLRFGATVDRFTHVGRPWGGWMHVHAAVCADWACACAAKRCAAGLKLWPCGRFSLPFGTKRPSGEHFSN